MIQPIVFYLFLIKKDRKGDQLWLFYLGVTMIAFIYWELFKIGQDNKEPQMFPQNNWIIGLPNPTRTSVKFKMANIN